MKLNIGQSYCTWSIINEKLLLQQNANVILDWQSFHWSIVFNIELGFSDWNRFIQYNDKFLVDWYVNLILTHQLPTGFYKCYKTHEFLNIKITHHFKTASSLEKDTSNQFHSQYKLADIGSFTSRNISWFLS